MINQINQLPFHKIDEINSIFPDSINMKSDTRLKIKFKKDYLKKKDFIDKVQSIGNDI
jgi:hypothetical protein